MSPRTPASIVFGTLATVSLFGLMQSMVGEPEVNTVPLRPPLDPFVSVAALPASLPAARREVPPRPEARQRPSDGASTPSLNIPTPAGPGEGPVVPPFQPGAIPRVVGPTTIGTPGSGDGFVACGEAQARLLVTPDYPRAQRAAGVEGEVEVAFTVAPDGRVLDPRVVRATPRGAFEAATLRAVRQWRFEAASAECPRAAEARTETVSFRLEGFEE